MSLTRLGHGGALECSVELADELIKLVVQGPKRATAGARARECPTTDATGWRHPASDGSSPPGIAPRRRF
jgi:hypothetical protein